MANTLVPALPPVIVTQPAPAPEQAAPLSSAATLEGGAAAGPLRWWPWLLVAILGGIGLALAVRRRRLPLAVAGDGDEILHRAQTGGSPPPPAPAPPSVVPPTPEPPLPRGIVTTRLNRSPAGATVTRAPAESAPALAPAPAVPGGVVSRRLRGWIELDLVMREIVFEAEQAVLRFDLLVGNNGAGPALAVALEAVALNAGEDQAAELAAFFARPGGSAPAISDLGPRGVSTISHELRVPRSAIRAYEAQGRALFVPVVAFSASYRTAGSAGRTGAAFLLGREVPGSDRLAPLVLPHGPGGLLGLGVRRLEEAVQQ